MNKIHALSFSVLLGASSYASAQIVQDMGDSQAAVLLKNPAFYDGLMVAVAVGPPEGRAAPNGEVEVAQRVRVLDSRAFATGSMVDVYLPRLGGRGGRVPQAGQPYDAAGGMPVGAPELLFARVVLDGLLRVPDLAYFDEPERPGRPIAPSDVPAAYGEGFFPTTRTQLASVADPRWRALTSLAEAIPGTGDDNARRIADLVFWIPWREDVSNYGRPDDRYSRLFAGAVANDTPYHRALVDFALNRLRYWGYGDRFSRDLRAAADDPNAFPDGVPTSFEFEEDPGTGNNPDLPKDFRHDPPLTQAEILGVLRRAKSPAIAAGFLHGLTAKPSDAEVRSLARFLDSPDPRLRRAMVERLAAWNGLPPPPEPKDVRGPDGRFVKEYPGLDEAVARWKAKLGTP